MFIKELEIEQTCNKGKDIFIKNFIGSYSLTVKEGRERDREREREEKRERKRESEWERENANGSEVESGSKR